MVSMHYQHPVEHTKPLKETDKPLGFGDRYGFKTIGDIWKEVPLYKYWEKKRNEEEQVIKDTKKVKCRILKSYMVLNDLTDQTSMMFLTYCSSTKEVKLNFNTTLIFY